MRLTAAFIILLLIPALAIGAQSSRPLRAGDRVYVRAGSDTIWSDSLPVDAEGRVFIPRVGPLDLHAVPAAALPAAVRTALASLYRQADATVIPLRRVSVTGEARRPGVYYLPVEATLRDAIAVAGGASDIGNVERVTLIRDGSTLLLRKWNASTHGAEPIASGDVLIVEREPWIKRNALTLVSTLSILVTTIFAVTR